MNTTEINPSSTRRYGNGLLDRVSVRAMPKGLRTPTLHVRNRWSSLKPGLPAAFSGALFDLRSEKVGA